MAYSYHYWFNLAYSGVVVLIFMYEALNISLLMLVTTALVLDIGQLTILVYRHLKEP